ncbi:cupin-like domain-containing protein [Streptomyces sp. NPDC055186]
MPDYGRTPAPKILDNVRRVRSISRADFLRDHVDQHEPVIVQDTQDGTPIASLRTAEGMAGAFGDLPIQVQENYTSPLSRGTAQARTQGLSQKVRNEISEMPLRDYLDHVRENPGTDRLCVEYRTPEVLRAAMRDPDVCEVPQAVEPLVSFMFVANRGNYAHMHFDGDFRNVLLYQIFGRKRVVIVPLESQEKVAPAMNFSKLLVQNMGEDEKLDLFRYLGAYDCIIEPGEAILFTPSVWHYVEYLDTGMSVNFRFGRGEFPAKLVDANRVPFYPELHQLLGRLVRLDDPAERTRQERLVWEQARPVLTGTYTDSRERHRAVQSLYRSLLSQVPGSGRPAVQVTTDCPVAESMAVERYDSPSLRWRAELMLGEPV